jgi:hypothetical protein
VHIGVGPGRDSEGHLTSHCLTVQGGECRSGCAPSQMHSKCILQVIV